MTPTLQMTYVLTPALQMMPTLQMTYVLTSALQNDAHTSNDIRIDACASNDAHTSNDIRTDACASNDALRANQRFSFCTKTLFSPSVSSGRYVLAQKSQVVNEESSCQQYSLCKDFPPRARPSLGPSNTPCHGSTFPGPR